MEPLFQSVISYFLKTREFFGGILEPALPWFYGAAVLLSIFFFWGIIHSIINSGYLARMADEYSNRFGIGDVSQLRKLRAWKKVLKRIKSAEMTDWKLAILECDVLFDEILKHSGIRGADVHERFEQFPSTSVSNYERLLQAHRVRDSVANDAGFILSQEEAMAVVKIYEQTFKELGLIS